jgi:phage tail tape-measure protein
MDRARRRCLPFFVVVLATAPFLVALEATPAGAATLTSVSWSVSNNQVSAADVTYSYSFKTASTGTIKSITFVVSGAGLGGTPAIVRNFGIGAGSVARAGQTITYTVTTAVSVSTGIPMYLGSRRCCRRRKRSRSAS